MANKCDIAKAKFSTFSMMWAIAAVLHLWNQVDWRTPDFLDLLTCGLAVHVILKPSHLGSFVLMTTCRVVHTGRDFPHIANHAFLALCVDLAILMTYRRMFVRRWPKIDGGELFLRFSPVAQAIFAMCYSFAALAKYNRDFINVEVSSAAVMYRGIAALWVPSAAEWNWAPYMAIVATMVFETATAVCLWIPRLRLAAVIIGSTFHFLLTATPSLPVFDFSATLFETVARKLGSS